jgi:uncharacterized protein with FMN-binding domain
MKRILRSKSALAAVVGAPLVSAVLVGVLAGCASTTSDSSSSSSGGTSSGSTSATSTTDDSSSSALATSYKDGTYTTDSDYTSPGGQEEIAVKVTVKNNVVTAVTVSTVSAQGEGAQYQARFENAISSAVVGKSLSGLSVSTVAGASLTSTAFNSALGSIRSDAA